MSGTASRNLSIVSLTGCVTAMPGCCGGHSIPCRLSWFLPPSFSASNYFLFVNSKSELAPQEDQGFMMAMLTAAPDATLQQTQIYSLQLAKILADIPEIEHIFQVEGFSGLNSGFAGLVLKPWDERTRTTKTLQPEIQNRSARLPAPTRWFFSRRPCPARATGCLCSLSSARPIPLPGSMKFRRHFWKRRKQADCSCTWMPTLKSTNRRACWRWIATNWRRWD